LQLQLQQQQQQLLYTPTLNKKNLKFIEFDACRCCVDVGGGGGVAGG